MTCDHQLGGGPLICTRPDPHPDGGHTYTADSGVPDRHDRHPNEDES